MDTMWRPKLLHEDGPKYLALARALRDAIRSGTLSPGDQLPTVRELAYQISVTPGTVSRAYHIATQEGLLEATVGRGTFVARGQPRLGPTRAIYDDMYPASTSIVDLRSPHLPDVGQGRMIAEVMQRHSGQLGRNWIDYPSQSAEAALRELIVNWLSPRVLGPVSAEDIMLTSGGQSSIGLVLDCCLRGERPVVLLEELAYPGFRYAARAARAEVVGVEIDHEGLRPDALEAACRRHGPQVLCLTPSAQNPTTAAMPESRRAEIVSIARRYDLHIIEDECYSVHTTEPASLRAMAPERVWHVGSLSKSVSAALRFGYVACPTDMGHAGRLAAQHSFFALSVAVTSLVEDLMRSGAADEIRQNVQKEFSARLELMVNRLGAFDLSWQPGFPFVWLRLPQGWRSHTFMREAEAGGVLMRSAEQYALATGRAPNAVRMAVAGEVSRQSLDAGMSMLAHLLPRPPSDMGV